MSVWLVGGDYPGLLKWAAEKIGIDGFDSSAKAIGIMRENRICGAVVYDSFTSVDCQMHVASDGSGHWMTRSFLRAVFEYPFVQLGYKRVTVPVAESNKRARVFVMNLGFKQEGYHPYGAKDGASITHGMLRENCAWISPSERHMKDK